VLILKAISVSEWNGAGSRDYACWIHHLAPLCQMHSQLSPVRTYMEIQFAINFITELKVLWAETLLKSQS